jgi:hypothetical protein
VFKNLLCIRYSMSYSRICFMLNVSAVLTSHTIKNIASGNFIVHTDIFCKVIFIKIYDF